MTEGDMNLLENGADWLGLELTQDQVSQFATYAVELVAWNKKFNLTAITDNEGIQTKHFLDSLTCFLGFHRVDGTSRPRPLSDLPSLAGTSVVDVGAGAGFPGIPLAIVRPEISLVLLESVHKKTVFLNHIVQMLGLERVSVLAGRAEEVGHQPGHREQYDVVVARAVASLAELTEYCLPLVKIGGRFIAPKKGEMKMEIDSARGAIEVLGGDLSTVLPVEVPGLLDPRVLVLIDKIAPTPGEYPRRPGVPAKRPLSR